MIPGTILAIFLTAESWNQPKMEEWRPEKKSSICPHCSANEFATVEGDVSSHLAFLLPILYVCRIFYILKKRLKLTTKSEKPHNLFSSLPCGERHFSMDFLHSCTAGILEQKHLQPVFVYGDISGYLSVFFFLSFLGGDLFISKCNKHRDGFPFTHRAICLHFRVKITFLLSGGKDRQVMSNTT